jgi:Uma2 family endonuclease
MLQEQYIQRYTYNDYLQWEDKWELINGYPYAMSPSPLPEHQWIGSNFIFLFKQALKQSTHKCNCSLLYECDWIINENTVVKPDILLICGDYNKKENIKTVPALIIEIFSPSTRLKDRNTKFSLYEQYGVKYYLMADPEKKSIEYFKLVDNKYQEQNMVEIFEPEKDCRIALNLSGVFSE